MKSRDRNWRSNQQAFTLIETIVALLILTVGLLSLAELFILSTYTNSFAYNQSVEIKAAEDTLELLRSLQFSDPRLSVGGTIDKTPAPCASGCNADQNHILGVDFQAVRDPNNNLITHFAMDLAPFTDSKFQQRQFEVRWQVIGYPTGGVPAGTNPPVMPFNAYDDAFPTTITLPAANAQYNVFPLTPPDSSGATALVVIVRVIPVGAKAREKFAKRVQLSTIISRPN